MNISVQSECIYFQCKFVFLHNHYNFYFIFILQLRDIYPVEMHNYSDKTYTRGLSSLCDIILEKPLNKEDRLCDWEKRPLMEKQLEYAGIVCL